MSTIRASGRDRSGSPRQKTGNVVQNRVESPFVTTTDVMSEINRHLADLHKHKNSSDTEYTGDEDNNNLRSKKAPRFELQRKFGDGTTRRASPAEQAANDMNSKLQQVAVHVASLSTTREQYAWAEAQRSLGNEFYHQQEYEQAIDVYLTCLIAVQPQDESDCLVLVLFLKVMNNLALSALQLGWYKKTIDFCTLALDRVRKQQSLHSHQQHVQLQMTKIYYKRGKARRLRGEYKQSRADLRAAQSQISVGEYIIIDESQQQQSFQEAIDKEFQLLHQAEFQGRRNQEKQQRAMRQILLHSGEKQLALGTATDQAANECIALYAEKASKRTFSALRAPATSLVDDDSTFDIDEESMTPTLWQYYLTVIGRVAETLLFWIGDEEYVQSVSERKKAM
ncbi:predicted protein [Phaeodactylum tricornutum CCAP 1055/1]|jgi:tetratricopeptide (TPR) repeat protein|uniref:Uncharacterized protein n=2 Tax=Phaeodactylum tricornutum TaxID=2850 RepID=B7G8T1_PHATC|nr:predicted protein [Phaeodactylum tricornutum CCAP 1055/1]EEC45224.1 predicted protein [Phaeodactylum tricornutum CCAP 1055/1]|eukprot:XP_002183524.1 predicted protein [Phaeodactylum tricornutum CCAP 1055/1]